MTLTFSKIILMILINLSNFCRLGFRLGMINKIRSRLKYVFNYVFH